MLTFVTFYMALSPAQRTRLGRLTRSFRIADNAPRWIDLLFRSARFFHPGCRCVLLSDNETVLPVYEGVEIHRRPVRANEPLWSRHVAERDFLRDADDDSDFVFVDFDVLLNGDISGVFNDAFDFALTYRFHAEMPINAGVMMAKAGRRREAIRFFDHLLSLYQAHFRDDLWWGEQRALALIVGEAGHQAEPPRCIEAAGVRIRLLPGDTFNYSPAGTRSLRKLPGNALVLHFKGRRKRLMQDHWDANTLRKERPDSPHLYAHETLARLRLAARAAFNG